MGAQAFNWWAAAPTVSTWAKFFSWVAAAAGSAGSRWVGNSFFTWAHNFEGLTGGKFWWNRYLSGYVPGSTSWWTYARPTSASWWTGSKASAAYSWARDFLRADSKASVALASSQRVWGPTGGGFWGTYALPMMRFKAASWLGAAWAVQTAYGWSGAPGVGECAQVSKGYFVCG